MTRINLVPPSELCDQHLLAEFREITRIPNGILKGTLKSFYPDAPKTYTLGAGHVKFFVDKIRFLDSRYRALWYECNFRSFNVTHIWPEEVFGFKTYVPSWDDICVNRSRICERMPKRARWTNRVRPAWAMENVNEV